MNLKIFITLLAFGFVGCAPPRNGMAPMAYDYELKEAKHLIDSGRFPEAIDQLTMLIQMNPKSAEALFYRGVAYQKLDHFSQAEADFSRLLEANPGHAKAHYNLGMIYAFKLRDSKKALSHFDQFLSLDPQNSEAFRTAKLMCTLDALDSDSGPNSVDIKSVIAKAQNAQGLADRRRILSEASRRYPESPVLYFLIGETYAVEAKTDKNALDSAITNFREAVSRRPTCASCRKALGEALQKKGDPKGAQMELWKAGLFEIRVN